MWLCARTPAVVTHRQSSSSSDAGFRCVVASQRATQAVFPCLEHVRIRRVRLRRAHQVARRSSGQTGRRANFISVRGVAKLTVSATSDMLPCYHAHGRVRHVTKSSYDLSRP
eukprot:344207-Pyramimonas_sp.AAC.3